MNIFKNSKTNFLYGTNGHPSVYVCIGQNIGSKPSYYRQILFHLLQGAQNSISCQVVTQYSNHLNSRADVTWHLSISANAIICSQSARLITVYCSRCVFPSAIYDYNNDGDKWDECHSGPVLFLKVLSPAWVVAGLIYFPLLAQSARKDFQFDSYSTSVGLRPV